MFHTVYNSFESKPHGRDYIGKHSSDNPYDEYMGSFTDESFDPDCKIVLGYSKTVEGAIWLEMQLQRVFRVAEDPQFANQSYQTSVGFSFSCGVSGEDHHCFGRKRWRNVNTDKCVLQFNCPGEDWVEGVSDLTRQKIRDSKLGENNPNYGKKDSEETRRKKRESHLGRKESEETKRKKSEASSGKKASKKTRQKLSSQRLGRKWWVNKNGDTMYQFDCPGPEWQNGRVWKSG